MSAVQHELQHIRRLLEARRDLLIERDIRVERDLGRENDPLSDDWSDQAVQRENDEALQAIGGAAKTEIEAIDTALQRLDAGLYGICNRCDGTIEAGRLAAVPYAVMCARCASS